MSSSTILLTGGCGFLGQHVTQYLLDAFPEGRIRVIDLAAFALPEPREVPGTAIGQVIHIDRFGNLITNLRQARLPAAPLRVQVAGQVIDGLSKTYQDSVDVLALIGSGGTLEIAFPNASAAKTLGVATGDAVRVSTAD